MSKLTYVVQFEYHDIERKISSIQTTILIFAGRYHDFKPHYLRRNEKRLLVYMYIKWHFPRPSVSITFEPSDDRLLNNI